MRVRALHAHKVDEQRPLPVAVLIAEMLIGDAILRPSAVEVGDAAFWESPQKAQAVNTKSRGEILFGARAEIEKLVADAVQGLVPEIDPRARRLVAVTEVVPPRNFNDCGDKDINAFTASWLVEDENGQLVRPELVEAKARSFFPTWGALRGNDRSEAACTRQSVAASETALFDAMTYSLTGVASGRGHELLNRVVTCLLAPEAAAQNLLGRLLLRVCPTNEMAKLVSVVAPRDMNPLTFWWRDSEPTRQANKQDQRRYAVANRAQAMEEWARTHHARLQGQIGALLQSLPAPSPADTRSAERAAIALASGESPWNALSQWARRFVTKNRKAALEDIENNIDALWSLHSSKRASFLRAMGIRNDGSADILSSSGRSGSERLGDWINSITGLACLPPVSNAGGPRIRLQTQEAANALSHIFSVLLRSDVEGASAQWTRSLKLTAASTDSRKIAGLILTLLRSGDEKHLFLSLVAACSKTNLIMYEGDNAVDSCMLAAKWPTAVIGLDGEDRIFGVRFHERAAARYRAVPNEAAAWDDLTGGMNYALTPSCTQLQL